MRLDAITIGATLASGVAASSHHHGHHHPIRRTEESYAFHGANHVARDTTNDSQPNELQKRSKTCSLPSGEGLVEVPGASNGGWAMSPDQSCVADSYCPYACPPGQVMAQWKPGSTYTYPSSMDGGVYCNKNGEVEKPFEDKPYCVDGTGTVKVQNKAGKTLSFCQTVLPGNEAMLIPTVVDSTATIAVPDESYWCGTSSHFYINKPGVGSEGCIWGTDSEDIGNWTPYVAGANTDSSGNTFLKIGWNPEWLKSGLTGNLPTYGLEIKCDGGGCNGLPCSISPDSDGVNGISAPSSGEIADTGSFCVCTIPKGSSASIVVTGGSGGSVTASSTDDDDDDKKEDKDAKTTGKPSPTTTRESAAATTMSSKPQYDDDESSGKAAIFFEHDGNSTDSSATATGDTSSDSEATGTFAAAAPSDTQKDEGVTHQGGAIASLVIALVVGLYLF